MYGAAGQLARGWGGGGGEGCGGGGALCSPFLSSFFSSSCLRLSNACNTQALLITRDFLVCASHLSKLQNYRQIKLLVNRVEVIMVATPLGQLCMVEIREVKEFA